MPGSRKTHFTPKGVSTYARPDRYKHATPTGVGAHSLRHPYEFGLAFVRISSRSFLKAACCYIAIEGRVFPY